MPLSPIPPRLCLCAVRCRKDAPPLDRCRSPPLTSTQEPRGRTRPARRGHEEVWCQVRPQGSTGASAASQTRTGGSTSAARRGLDDGGAGVGDRARNLGGSASRRAVEHGLLHGQQQRGVSGPREQRADAPVASSPETSSTSSYLIVWPCTYRSSPCGLLGPRLPLAPVDLQSPPLSTYGC